MLKIDQQLGIKSGTFEGGNCHVKIIKTFARNGEGFLFAKVIQNRSND